MFYALKSYIFFTPVPEGVYFSGGQRRFLLRGPGLYLLVSRILAAFDGSRSLQTIERALPPNARPLMHALLGRLRENHMVTEMRTGARREAAERWQLYEETLTFLRDATERFEEVFARWRSTPIVACGGGYALKALVRSLARSGVGRIEVRPDGSCATPGIVEIGRALEDHRRQDAEFGFEVDERRTADVLALCEGRRVLYASDRVSLDDPRSVLSQLAQLRDRPVLIGGVLEGVGVVGPDPAQGGATFADLWQRIARRTDDVSPSITMCSIIGNLVALEALKAEASIQDRFGTPGRYLHDGVLQVEPSCEIHRRALMTCRPGQLKGARDVGSTPAGAEGAASVVGVRGAAEEILFDPLTGFLARTTNDHPQIPLPHRELTVRLPRRFGGAVCWVIRWGWTPEEADANAMLAAASVYSTWIETLEGTPGRVSVSAGRDRESWRRAALAAGIVSTEQFARQSVARRIDLDGCTEERVVGLARMARIFTAVEPQVVIRFVPGLPACVAWASLGNVVAEAVSHDAADAVARSLGNACSLVQIPEQGDPSRYPRFDRLVGDVPLIDAKAKGSLAEIASDVSSLERFELTAHARMGVWDPCFEAGALTVGRIDVQWAPAEDRKWIASF